METNPERTIYLIAVLITFGLGFAMGLGRIFGRATTTFYHARKSLQLQLKDGTHTSIADLCKSTIPPCNLNPFIFNGHLQTMWTVLKSQDIPIYYKRHVFENEDPVYAGTYAVDFVARPYEGADPTLPERTTYFLDNEFEKIASSDSRPMLVVLHGLSGGSHELYLRHVLAPLISEEGGWEACVVNSRGCAMSKITTSVLYNARATWDVRQTVKWLRKTFPNRPLFGVGFSLGANIITNYIGEEGAECVLKAALVLSNPWNLEAGSLALQRTWMGLNVYSRAMGNSMKALFESHVEQISKNPKIDVEAVRKIKYLHDFDREVQGPTWGYPTEGAYYRDATSTDSLLAVRIPFLAIHARDDPIAAGEALPRHEVEQTPYGVLCTTSLGGHLSWFELGGGRWFSKASTAFFQKMVREVDFEKISHEDASLEGWVSRQDRDPLRPVFQPTRRKLDLPTHS
jgi:predicted alpha/beta-fold hydrolase